MSVMIRSLLLLWMSQRKYVILILKKPAGLWQNLSLNLNLNTNAQLSLKRSATWNSPHLNKFPSLSKPDGVWTLPQQHQESLMMRVMLWVLQSEHEMLRSKVRPVFSSCYLISCWMFYHIFSLFKCYKWISLQYTGLVRSERFQRIGTAHGSMRKVLEPFGRVTTL